MFVIFPLKKYHGLNIVFETQNISVAVGLFAFQWRKQHILIWCDNDGESFEFG